jgi:hypothetical protein
VVSSTELLAIEYMQDLIDRMYAAKYERNTKDDYSTKKEKL